MKLNKVAVVGATMMLSSLALGGYALAESSAAPAVVADQAETSQSAGFEQDARVFWGSSRVAYAPVRVVARFAPPPVRFEYAGRAPSERHFWTPGNWHWDGGQHVWIAGRWQERRSGYQYVNAHWEVINGQWCYTPGHWVRRWWRVW